jgi:SAM-dependent methyltransferase
VSGVEASDMRQFWDERAREDALFFVDDRRVYGDPDPGDFWAQGERDLERLLEAAQVGITASDAVLDIGCGVGRLTRAIAHRAKRVYAIDVSPRMIERARGEHAELDNVEWILGDGRSLAPFAPESVDVCISHVVFQHIPDPEITLGYVAEMGRVLTPGGRAGFGISNDASVHRPRRGARARARRMAASLGRRPQGQDEPAWLGSSVDLGRLRQVASGAGLDVERVVGDGTQICVIGARKLAGAL